MFVFFCLFERRKANIRENSFGGLSRMECHTVQLYLSLHRSMSVFTVLLCIERMI